MESPFFLKLEFGLNWIIELDKYWVNKRYVQSFILSFAENPLPLGGGMNARIVIDFRYIVLQYYRKFFRLMKQNTHQSITNVVYNNVSINIQNGFPNICTLYFALYVSPDGQQISKVDSKSKYVYDLPFRL